MTIYVIEDEAHAEWCGEFPTFESALNELKVRANIPWDSKPNQCPVRIGRVAAEIMKLLSLMTQTNHGKSYQELLCYKYRLKVSYGK